MLSLLTTLLQLYSAPAFANAVYDPANLACDVFLTAPAAHRAVVGRLARSEMPTADVVAYVPITPDELLTLTVTGHLAFADEGRRTSDVGTHPAVTPILRGFDEDAAIASADYALAEATREARTVTVTEVLAARARAAGFELNHGRIGFRNFVEELGELIGDAAYQLKDGPGFDPVKALQDLAGPVRPAKFFARLPRRAGFVLALRSEALGQIQFRPEHVPYIHALALDDVVGLLGARPEDQNFLTGL